MYFRSLPLVPFIFIALFSQGYSHYLRRRVDTPPFPIPNSVLLDRPDRTIITNSSSLKTTSQPSDPWIKRNHEKQTDMRAENYREPYTHYTEVQKFLTDMTFAVTKYVNFIIFWNHYALIFDFLWLKKYLQKKRRKRKREKEERRRAIPIFPPTLMITNKS